MKIFGSFRNSLRNYKTKLFDSIKTPMVTFGTLIKTFYVQIMNNEFIELFIKIYKQTSPITIITIFAEIYVGFLLITLEKYYLLIPGVLLVIPGIMESRGNIVSNLAQRLGTSVHLGLVNWDLGFNEEVRTDVIATILLNMLSSLGLSTLGFFVAYLLGINHMTWLGYFTVVGTIALTVGTVLTLLAIFVVLLATKYNLDPDNVTIPVIATLGDILTVASLGLVLEMVIYLDKLLPIFY